MTKENPNSNVIKMPRRTSRSRAGASPAERLRMAKEKIYEAWETTGEARMRLAKEALAFSEDCADAYLLLAAASDDGQKRIEHCRQAVAAGVRALGVDWESKYKGICWVADETRPVMRAQAQLAMELEEEKNFEEALTIFRKLMTLNPNDNQGIRYLLISCLYRADCGDELESILKKNSGDTSATVLYTKALHFFRKDGSSKRSDKALKDAFKENKYVPIFLSDTVELPDEPPSSIGFGDDREAVAYVMADYDLWWCTEGATAWMAQKLESSIRKSFDDKELVDDATAALLGN